MEHKRAYIILVAWLWINFSNVTAQDQKIADSLVHIYQNNKVTGVSRFDLLKELSFNEISNNNTGLRYAEELIDLSKKEGNDKYLRIAYFLKGTKQRLLGNINDALEAYFKSADIARRLNHLKGEGEAYGAIGDTYLVAKDYSNALQYYYRAIGNLREAKGDSVSLASVISNTGEVHLKLKNYDSALFYFNKAKKIFVNLQYQTGIGYSVGNIGMVYANTGDNVLAEKNMNEAIRILDKAQDYYPICVYLVSMADIYSHKSNNQAAFNYTNKSLDLAAKYGLKEQIAEASLKLSELFEKKGKPIEALTHYKKYVLYRDSISNLANVQKMATLQNSFEIAQKQGEIDRANHEKRKLAILLLSILGLTIMLFISLYWVNRYKAKEKVRLHEQELLTARLEIQEQTYRNISQELHDNIGQALTLVKLNINTVNTNNPKAADEKLAETANLLTKAIQDIRNISKTLNTDFINDRGLIKGIENQLQLLTRTGLYSVDLVVEGEVFDYEPHCELLIFRAVQELLNNIVKHAAADKITVTIKYEAEKMIIHICDNGKGFDIHTKQPSQNDGLGLRNIHNRLRLINGSVCFESNAGRGTIATLEIQKKMA